jgi:hypothetical protein
MNRHKDFWQVTEDSLDKSMKAFKIDYSMRNELLDLYKILSTFPEVKEVLKSLKEKDYKLAILSNGTPTLLNELVKSNNLANMFDDIFSAEKTLELHKAMEIINKEGCGAVVMLRTPSNTFISDKLKKDHEEQGLTFRGYGIGALILLELGIHEMIVLSNTERTLVGLEGYGLTIVERKPIKINKNSPVPVGDGFYE